MRLNTEYKRIPGHSRKQIHKARVKNTTPVQSLNNFDEVDVTSRQLEGMDDVNKRVATSPKVIVLHLIYLKTEFLNQKKRFRKKTR